MRVSDQDVNNKGMKGCGGCLITLAFIALVTFSYCTHSGKDVGLSSTETAVPTDAGYPTLPPTSNETLQATAIAPLRPAWARLLPGTKAYTRATIREEEHNTVSVCPTKTDFTSMMEGSNNTCTIVSAGIRVVIHKTGQDPGIFGGDAIYVIAKDWSGLVEDDEIAPVVPRGTVVHCDENDDGWSLFIGGYSNDDEVSIGRSAFKAIVRHTLEPSETLGPAVHLLSGGGSGKDGFLLFDALDKSCKIDGTSFEPDFDTYSYERGEPADGSTPP